jgi:hypothetical protein
MDETPQGKPKPKIALKQAPKIDRAMAVKLAAVALAVGLPLLFIFLWFFAPVAWLQIRGRPVAWTVDYDLDLQRGGERYHVVLRRDCRIHGRFGGGGGALDDIPMGSAITHPYTMGGTPAHLTALLSPEHDVMLAPPPCLVEQLMAQNIMEQPRAITLDVEDDGFPQGIYLLNFEALEAAPEDLGLEPVAIDAGNEEPVPSAEMPAEDPFGMAPDAPEAAAETGAGEAPVAEEPVVAEAPPSRQARMIERCIVPSLDAQAAPEYCSIAVGRVVVTPSGVANRSRPSPTGNEASRVVDSGMAAAAGSVQAAHDGLRDVAFAAAGDGMAWVGGSAMMAEIPLGQSFDFAGRSANEIYGQGGSIVQVFTGAAARELSERAAGGLSGRPVVLTFDAPDSWRLMPERPDASLGFVMPSEYIDTLEAVGDDQVYLSAGGVSMGLQLPNATRAPFHRDSVYYIPSLRMLVWAPHLSALTPGGAGDAGFMREF